MRLNRYSRGVLVMCSGGGIIQKWTNIYRSESLGQVCKVSHEKCNFNLRFEVASRSKGIPSQNMIYLQILS